MLCAIPNCKNSSRNVIKYGKRISFFSLPHNPKIRKIWLKATKKPSTKHSDYVSICSDHFEDKYIKKCCVKTMLISGAIPTLKLYEDNEDELKSNCDHNEKPDELNCTEDNHEIINERMDIQHKDESEQTGIDGQCNDENRSAMIEKCISNILEQLTIITDYDLDKVRSDMLKTDVSNILSHYKSVAIVENHLSTKNETKDTAHQDISDVKEEDSGEMEDFGGNDCDDSLNDSDCDLKTFKLRNMKSMKENCTVKKKKVRNKLLKDHHDVSKSCDEDIKVCEDSDDSVYDLYPMAKSFLIKMQKFKAMRKRSKKNVLMNCKDANFTCDGKPVVRHTCPDCDLSFSTAYLLSVHPSYCKARLCKDNKLSYWAKKECPECHTKFSTKSNLRRHLIIHRLREYKSKMVEMHGKIETDGEISAPNPPNTCDSNPNKVCVDFNVENKDKTDVLEEKFHKNDSNGTIGVEENIFQDNGLNKTAISNILNTTNEDNSINLKFNVSSVKYVSPNSSEATNNSFECTVCDAMCHSNEELLEHNKNQHPEGVLPYICNHCPNNFKTLSTLRMHVKTCHKEVTTAGGRNKYLAGKSEIANSYPKNIDFKVFACSRCAKIFLSVKDLQTHERKGNCNASSQFKSDKMKLHRINSKYPCQYCGKIYKTYTGLKLHILDHTKELSYSCPKCPRRFKASFHLKKHMNNIHEKKYCICEICGAKYSNIYYLKRHLLVHNNIRNFKCNYCPKSFVYKSSMKSHIRVHTQEKPWVCQYCNQAFSERRNWRIHVNEHEGLKPFKCSSCQEAFVSKRKLNKHVHDHHN